MRRHCGSVIFPSAPRWCSQCRRWTTHNIVYIYIFRNDVTRLLKIIIIIRNRTASNGRTQKRYSYISTKVFEAHNGKSIKIIARLCSFWKCSLQLPVIMVPRILYRYNVADSKLLCEPSNDRLKGFLEYTIACIWCRCLRGWKKKRFSTLDYSQLKYFTIVPITPPWYNIYRDAYNHQRHCKVGTLWLV